MPEALAQGTALSGRAQQLDTNKNGVVDRDEARGPIEANFDDIDCNRSGGLDGAEIRGFFTGSGCPKASAKDTPAASKLPPLNDRAKGLDANGNGLVDRDEARGPLAASFDDIDCDKNGGLDGAEIPAFFQGKACAESRDESVKTDGIKTKSKSKSTPKSEGSPGGGRPPQAVQLAEVRLETTDETYSVIGRITALQTGALSTKVSGSVDAVSVDVGDRVEKGQTVVRLSNSRLRAERRRIAAQVARQQSMVDNVNRELKRMRELSKSAAYSRAKFEDQQGLLAEREAQVAEFKAAMDRVTIDIEDASIRAPYDAIVVAKHVEVGSYVNVGSPVLTLLNDRRLEVEVEVPTFRIANLKLGTPVTVVADNGKRYPAKVRSIIPNDNTRTRTRPMRLEADFGDDAVILANNQSVTVELPLTTGNQILTVPKDAIVRRANGAVVFVVEGGNANMRTVQLGRGVGNKFQVLDGLKAGDKVVIRGNERLGAGGRVRVQN
ncbi:MAG: efflux RND transporter periplasmic adaptor subunit [Proteobacteria bacterium]|nr:efflux RND transporter periplasmic adaptor subunit [Pseudomonadota bacterium]